MQHELFYLLVFKILSLALRRKGVKAINEKAARCVLTTDYRPPTTDHEVNSGLGVNEKEARYVPTTDYRPPTTNKLKHS